VLGFHVPIDIATERGIRSGPAANKYMIALHLLAAACLPRGERHFAGEQADVADVMLRAGVMTAGEMNVDRRIEVDAALTPSRDLIGVTLGVGSRKSTSSIARAGDEPGADRGCLRRQLKRHDCRFDLSDLVVRHA